MKAFMRFCGMMALFLLGGGLVLTIGGYALGGADRVDRVVRSVTGGRASVSLDPMTDFGITTGWFETETAVIEEGVVFEMEGPEIFWVDDYATVYGIEQSMIPDDSYLYPVDCNGVENLKVDAGGCEFQIVPSSDDAFWLQVQGDNKLKANVKGDTLCITAERNGKAGATIFGSPVVTLFVPYGFKFDEVELELGAGRIVIEELYADRAKIEVGAGDLTVESMDVGKLDCQVGLGNMELTGVINGNVKAECSMGNITLKLYNDKKDFNYKLECAMGNLELNGRRYTGIANAEKIDNGARQEMNLECAMGNIEVIFE